MRYETFIERITPKFSPGELALIERAYRFAKNGHNGQARADGSPYIGHPIAVADILAELGLPADAIEAGLLHDVVEDNESIHLEDIKREFGEPVARLVDGVTKLTGLPRVSRAGELDDEPLTAADWARIRQAETVRKTILAMNDDVRVVIIKLADRLHNMRTLGNLRPDKQRRIAQETLDIFAPLANRLGIWQIKWELEDRCFRYLNPDRYHEISRGLAERRESREQVIANIVERLRSQLEKHGINANVSGRPKHIYSIYKKMERKQVPLDQIYDARAVRVLVDTIPQCYTALGVVHVMGRPIPNEFDDYIAAPKDNFYQSLHTAIIYDDGKTLEVQIRTKEMHRHAEYGIAAHWRYKEGGKQDKRFEHRVAYLRSMIDWHEEIVEGEAFMDALKSDVFQDRVYAFTPRGDAIDLPQGSTPVDFAYHIHTEVGHRCRGARVNGKLVALNYTLKNGDQIEILTTKRGGPSRDWLNKDLGYVGSTRARQKIRTWFRKQDRDQHISAGRELIQRELKRLSITRWAMEEVAQMQGYTGLDEFLVSVGRGDINPQTVVNRLVIRLRAESPEDSASLPPPNRPPTPQARQSDEVVITGVAGLLTHMARCCNPVPGDPITGYTTRGRGVTIHRQDCPNVLRLNERERLITVNWGSKTKTTYPVPVRVVAFDRDGLLRDIANVVADEKINMSSVYVPRVKSPEAVVNATLDVVDLPQLLRVLNRIEQLPNVTSVRRSKG